MKSERHRKILEIINKNDIETQEELAAALIDAVFTLHRTCGIALPRAIA